MGSWPAALAIFVPSHPQLLGAQWPRERSKCRQTDTTKPRAILTGSCIHGFGPTYRWHNYHHTPSGDHHSDTREKRHHPAQPSIKRAYTRSVSPLSSSVRRQVAGANVRQAARFRVTPPAAAFLNCQHYRSIRPTFLTKRFIINYHNSINMVFRTMPLDVQTVHAGAGEIFLALVAIGIGVAALYFAIRQGL